MKLHPGASTNTHSKAQTNDNDNGEDCRSHSAGKNPGGPGEKQGLAKSPEKGDSLDPLPISVGANVEGEKPMDATV